MRIIETSRDGDNFKLRVMDCDGNVLLLHDSDGNAEYAQELRRTTLAILAVMGEDCAHFHNQPGAADKYLKSLDEDLKMRPGD